MCKTIDELNAKVKALQGQINSLTKEIECMQKAQCSGCKYRTKTCETGEN